MSTATCARCGISDDGHPGSSIFTAGPPHQFVRWASPWGRICRARHAAWNVRCELPRGHDGTHLADRGMDRPEWIELPAVDGRPLLDRLPPA